MLKPFYTWFLEQQLADRINFGLLICQIFVLLGSVFGLVAVWRQLNQNSNIAKSTLLMSVNRDLNNYSDIAVKIGESAHEAAKLFLSSTETERLLDYISYFEGLYLAYSKGLFTVEEINDYFGGRFFRLTNHRKLQDKFLYNTDEYSDIFRPIFRLHKVLSDYRAKNGMIPLFKDNDLSANELDVYELLAIQATGAKRIPFSRNFRG